MNKKLIVLAVAVAAFVIADRYVEKNFVYPYGM